MKFRDKYDFNNSIDDGGKSTIRNSPRYFGNNYNHKIKSLGFKNLEIHSNIFSILIMKTIMKTF